MKNTLKAVFVDPYKGIGSAYIGTVDNDWRSITQALGCDWMEVVCRRFGGKAYTIICDEEGLLKEHNRDKISIATGSNNDEIIEVIVGKVLICKTKGDNFQSLNKSDIELILNQKVVIFGSDGKPRYALKCTI